MLRPFLSLIHDDPQIAALQRDGGRAFVASSLRPYLVAALADEILAAATPALVVAGDDPQPAGRPPARRGARGTPAGRATWPPTSRPGSRRGRCASTRAAASPTNPIWF